MRKTKVTKCENTDMQENAQYIIAFLTEEEGGLSAIVAMICEDMIGVYMHTVLRMRQYAKIVRSNANEIHCTRKKHFL